MNSFITRTLSGVVFLIVFLAGILLHPFGYAALMLFIVIMGMQEFYKITMPNRSSISLISAYFTGFFLFQLFFLSGMGYICEATTYWLLIVPVCALCIQELYARDNQPFKQIALSVWGIVYVALPFSFTNTITLDGTGNYDHRLLLALFIFLWANDVGAYCFGMLFGRHGKHKLFERISPKKSWEGFIGGLITATSMAFIVHSMWGDRYNMSILHWLILSLIISIIGTYGDLFESLLKRSAGIKDSANLIPGHGGLLDRFDGALLAFPCAIAYIHLMKLI